MFSLEANSKKGVLATIITKLKEKSNIHGPLTAYHFYHDPFI